MPGNVAASTPTTVLPNSLFTGLAEDIEYAAQGNEYKDGESQRATLVGSSRRRWRFSKRLTRAQIATLRGFYLARKGSLEAFYMYHPHETSPRFSYDATGVATTGRYTVRFEGPFSLAWTNSARGDVTLAIVQCL